MGLGQDAKDLILGNDGSDKEPDDFKRELKKAIDSGLVTKADGTLLITSRTNCDKLADLIARSEEKEVIKSSKENRNIEVEEKKKEKEEKERKRIEKLQKNSLEQQINETKAKIEAEKNLGKGNELDRRK